MKDATESGTAPTQQTLHWKLTTHTTEILHWQINAESHGKTRVVYSVPVHPGLG